MRSDKKPVNVKRDWSQKGLVVFITLLGSLMCCFNEAKAQRGSQSDWNVPPPLAPGTITRGDRDGRPGNGGAAALTFVDVPAAALASGSVSVPDLAPISATAPDADQPQQPSAGIVIAALPNIPMPGTPELPGMPDRTLQDVAEPALIDVPMPDAPELPAPPAEPVGSAIPSQPNTGLLPLMPEVSGQAAPFNPPPAGTMLWNVPGVPQNSDFKLNR